ncbi:LysR family transcriptional regulator [Phytoactinopolyspora limicola]|uniref:LysR family transcriptional regulator n=1 Tax=Phytoactinopolyspora limicola TaxID=2715536 RepID=UPI00140BB795|nr:LysR family transcriptional regulator [Phytoactinopolyspora limicola]
MPREPDFTLVQLRYFAAAAEAGSMTRAANELLVSQSAVSTAVAQLEREFGVQLFIRHHAKGLSLTHAGEAFLAEIRNLLNHASELIEVTHGLGHAVRGSLHVGYFTTLAPFFLPRLLTEFGQRYPDVTLSFFEGEIEAVREATLTGRVEVALLYDIDLGDEVERTTLADVPVHVIVAADHPLATAGRIHLADIAAEPMILLDLPHSAKYFMSVMAAAGATPQVRHRSTNYETVRALVAAGHGYALLNQRSTVPTEFEQRPVAILEIADDVPSLPLVVAYPRGARLTRRAQAFISVCQRMWQSQPGT